VADAGAAAIAPTAPRRALDRAGRAVDDDRAAGSHQRHRVLAGEQGAAYVHAEHVLERVNRDRLPRLGQGADAGGVDDVDAAEAGLDASNRRAMSPGLPESACTPVTAPGASASTAATA